jgi:hypothetical protein
MALSSIIGLEPHPQTDLRAQDFRLVLATLQWPPAAKIRAANWFDSEAMQTDSSQDGDADLALSKWGANEISPKDCDPGHHWHYYRSRHRIRLL